MLQDGHSLEMAGGWGLRISELAEGCGDSRARVRCPLTAQRAWLEEPHKELEAYR